MRLTDPRTVIASSAVISPASYLVVCCATWCGVVQCGAVRRGAAWCRVVQSGAVWCGIYGACCPNVRRLDRVGVDDLRTTPVTIRLREHHTRVSVAIGRIERERASVAAAQWGDDRRWEVVRREGSGVVQFRVEVALDVGSARGGRANGNGQEPG